MTKTEAKIIALNIKAQALQVEFIRIKDQMDFVASIGELYDTTILIGTQQALENISNEILILSESLT